MTKPPEPVVTGELKVTPDARKAAADLLDEVSSLLGDDGIGQVADLIRDGEYDEHDATLAFAKFERDILARHRTAHALPGDVGTAEREALAGYRAAVSFISADSWDGCSDCINILKAARVADLSHDQNDQNVIAAELSRIRMHYSPADAPFPSALSGDAVRIDAIIEAAIEVCGKGQASPASVNRLRAALPSHQGAGDE